MAKHWDSFLSHCTIRWKISEGIVTIIAPLLFKKHTVVGKLTLVLCDTISA